MIPILIDSDIGSNVDDAYALFLAAVSPELELRAVTTANHDVQLRARIASLILGLLGKGDIPIVPGEATALDGTLLGGWYGFEGEGLQLPPRRSLQVQAPDLIAQEARRGTTIVAIAQMTNVALALRQLTTSEREETKIVAMASSFNGFGREAAERESNSSFDAPALQEVLASGAQIWITGLNVTRQFVMTAAELERLRLKHTPLTDAIATMHDRYLASMGRAEATLHDPVAVVAAFRSDLFTFEPMRAEVHGEEGLVVFHPGTPNCEVAVGFDPSSCKELLLSRVLY